MIVHGDEQVLPTHAVHRIAPITGDTMAGTRDSTELLDVDVKQVAWRLVFVALNGFTRLQVAHSGTRQHAADGRGRHACLSGDLALEQALLTQFHDHQGRRRSD